MKMTGDTLTPLPKNILPAALFLPTPNTVAQTAPTKIIQEIPRQPTPPIIYTTNTSRLQLINKIESSAEDYENIIKS